MILNELKVRMFEDFLSNITEGFTASQIAKSKGLNQKSVYLFMEELEQVGILTSLIQGKNKLYYLNLANRELLFQFLCTIEHLKTFFFYEKNKDLKQFIQKILPNINGMALIFGSYAKGTQKNDSDIDLFIAGKLDKIQVTSLIDTYHKEISLKHYPNFKIDTLTKEVIKNNIILKGVEQFVGEVLIHG